ncbi:DedA family protein [Arthrobacter ginkgonis]|uniref:DedA family protein n=1 Tax=Arthrobacter ginkgonis TaxID=1630594 RepID=A0ABP7C6P5_9MICC
MNLDAALAGNLGPWYYPLMLVLVALDAALPPVPSELLVLGAGSMAAQGSLNPVAAVLAAAAGCWAGDIALYLVFRNGLTQWFGRFRWGRWGHRNILRLMGKAGRETTYAGLVGARFLSGGRTASVAAAGMANLPLGPFLALSGTGALLWSTWMVALGYVTGNSTGLSPWISAVIGMGLGTLVGLVIAGGMAIRARRKGALSHDQHVG